MLDESLSPLSLPLFPSIPQTEQNWLVDFWSEVAEPRPTLVGAMWKELLVLENEVRGTDNTITTIIMMPMLINLLIMIASTNNNYNNQIVNRYLYCLNQSIIFYTIFQII